MYHAGNDRSGESSPWVWNFVIDGQLPRAFHGLIPSTPPLLSLSPPSSPRPPISEQECGNEFSQPLHVSEPHGSERLISSCLGWRYWWGGGDLWTESSAAGRTHFFSRFIYCRKVCVETQHSWSQQMEITSQCKPRAPYSGRLPTCKLSSSFPSLRPVLLLTFRQCGHCVFREVTPTKNHYAPVVVFPAGT